ncbi:MAG: hypothetical protein KY464_17895, partial [Gemmatimonadetes bacterium]|nr:hypothetical protein [Gemmatimonadota bacterium]
EGARQEDIDMVRKTYGLDRPLLVQYLEWLWRTVKLDFGESLYFKTGVTGLVADKLPTTLLLGVLSLSFALLVAIPLGVAAAGAAEGLSVLVIDADLRTQGLSDMLELPDHLPGLVEAAAHPHDDPTRFILMEIYRSQEDPARHKGTAHYATWRDTVESMMAEPRRSVKYRAVFPEAAAWEMPA